MGEPAKDIDLEDVEREIRQGFRLPRFSPAIERRYEADTSEYRCRQMIRQNYIGLIIYHCFLYSDYFNIRDVFVLDLWIHFAVMTPLTLGVNFVLARNPSPWIREGLEMLSAAFLTLTIAVVVASSMMPDRDIVLFSIILVVLFMVTMQKIQFLYCAVGCLFMQLSFVFGLMSFPEFSPDRIMTSNAILSGVIIFSLIGSYNLEHEQRTGYLLTLRDRFRNRDLEIASLCDALTGLGNRRALDADLRRLAGRRSTEAASATAVCLLDIDHFKRFNDTNGHQEGDACLKRVADLIAGSIRKGEGAVYRFGGEEFLILLDIASPGDALAAAERIRANVERARIPREPTAGTTFVTVSIGAAFGCVGHGIGSDALIAAADRALYAAKHDGRNCVRSFPEQGAAPSGDGPPVATTPNGALILEERVRAAFLAERARRSVAGDEGDVVAERQDLLPDRPDQLVVVAAR